MRRVLWLIVAIAVALLPFRSVVRASNAHMAEGAQSEPCHQMRDSSRVRPSESYQTHAKLQATIRAEPTGHGSAHHRDRGCCPTCDSAGLCSACHPIGLEPAGFALSLVEAAVAVSPATVTPPPAWVTRPPPPPPRA